MPDKHLEPLPGQLEEDPDALRIIAERLQIRGAITIQDLELRLKKAREKRLREP